MHDVERVRAFNRRWTEVIGLLDAGLLETSYSLPEARVMFELGRRGDDEPFEQIELRRRLRMDPSYLTRIVARLQRSGLVRTYRSDVDRRHVRLALTPAGRAAFTDLDRRSAAQISALLEPLTDHDRRRVVLAIDTIERILYGDRPREVTVRGLDSGDLGWVIQRHGEVYRDEYQWDMTFEALVAEIVANYVSHHRPEREHAWIAEVDGSRAGCVFCCQRDADTAQLRILLVEPSARGLGIGRRLVDECIDFARSAGYSTMMLWTNDVLVSARRIYEAAGFELVDEEPHHSFGHDLVGQNWELAL
ncbi:MAG TPA: bifunctional helix-turn-helix transcriptional regulator/GNAT family N-acetyltransferase [Ilumatobacteraceae bacterium]|nr:bifunctional helix-turn-helix transcriptional regulator/GNAT family N-acetyltransferase [Ilumatobacteraceae bacterium]